MKKLFSIILCVTMLVCLAACKTPSAPTNNSSEINQNEYELTLIRALTATDDVSSIQSFEIIHEYSSDGTIISDSTDLKFLEKYTYSHIYPSDKLHELLLFPNTYIINITINDTVNKVYLLKDGSIVKSQMCGDSEVTDIDFDVYTADSQYMLTQERLIELLKKYDGYQK